MEVQLSTPPGCGLVECSRRYREREPRGSSSSTIVEFGFKAVLGMVSGTYRFHNGTILGPSGEYI